MTIIDGSANASAGSPQLPDLLDGYSVRPPWMVAGVDYAVGVPSGTVLKNPLSITNPNIGVDTARHLIWVNGDNITLSGYDFTGWQVYIQGGHQNTTITNSYFGAGGGVYADPSSVNVTIQYCSFNNLGDGSSSLITLSGTGSKIVQYNWLQNSAQHFLELNNGGAVNYSYNLIENGGQTVGSHLNVIQFQGGALVANYVNPIISFNTILQTPQVAGGELVQLYNPGVGIVNGLVSNNTMIALPDAAGNPSVSYMINASNSLTSGVVRDNYMYDAGGGAYGFFYPGAPVTYSNNINMANGKIIQGDNSEIVGSITSSPSGVSGVPVIASFSTDSGTVGDHITSDNTLTLTGTAAANSTVNVYDGSMLLGTAAANGSGAWSFATAALTNGIHSFIAKTGSGTATAASTALSVTIDTAAPTAPVISNNSISPTNVVTLSGTAEAGSKVTVFDGTAQLGTTTANTSGAWSFITAALPNGSHSFKATDADAAGNTSGASTALNVTLNAPVNLVTNGSFETGTFSGWTLGGNSAVSWAGPQTYINGQSQSGQFAAALGSMGTDGILSQTLQTTAGQQYKLSFWLANQSAGADDFTVKWNGVKVLSLVNAPAQAYTQYTFTVTATGTTSTLEFDSRNDPSHWSLDNISVTAIGQPAPSAPAITSFSTDSGVVGDHITNDNTLTLAGTAASNSTVKVFDGANQIGTATTNSGGAWTYTTAALANGSHSLTAKDNAGTTSTALSVTIDTLAPSVPSIVSNTVSSNKVTLNGTAEANSTVKVYDGAGLLGNATANSSGAWTYTTAVLPNGVHNLTATATDAAGNTGPASATLAITVTAPLGAPTITSFSPDTGIVGDGITDPAILTLTGTASANSTVNVYDGAKLLGTTAANASGGWTFTTIPLPDGVHSLTATSILSGSTSAASAAMKVTIDTVAPVAPTITAFSNDSGRVGDHITNDTTLTLTGAAEANATVTVFDGAKLLGSAVANGSGTWSYTTAALTEGAHSLTAKASDVAANTSVASSALAVTIDTKAPVAPTIASFSNDTGTLGDHITNDTTLTLTGIAEANSVVKVFDGAMLLGSATANGNGGWSYTTDTMAFGLHNLIATDTDAAGNVSGPSAALNVSIEKPPIEINIEGYSAIVPNFGYLKGTADANSMVWLYDGNSGAARGVALANDTGSWTLPVFGQANSVRDFVVTAFNDGNKGSAHVVFGTTANDKIATSASNEFVFGSGGNDTFVFSGNIGKDTVADFNASNDVVELSHNIFADFAAVLNHASQTGSDVTIAIDPSNSVTLHNTSFSQLTTHNIHIV